jgi:hypothetical protein
MAVDTIDEGKVRDCESDPATVDTLDLPRGTMITARAAADACERILGGIPTVQVTVGSFGATVMLGDEPVITISPVQGQVLIATQKWLRARPKQSPTLLHSTSKKDEDWQYCTTPSFRELSHALHLAAPALEHRATLPQRIAARLGGVTARRLNETEPRYWVVLARWIEGSGLLTRNDAKFARIYARQLRKGTKSSDVFREWAIRTSAAAVKAGFPATEPPEIQREVSDQQSADEEQSPHPQAPGIAIPQAVLRLIEQIRLFEMRQVSAIASAPHPDEDLARRVRAAVIRAGNPELQRAAKAAAALAVRELRTRLGVVAGLDRVAALAAETAAALAVRDSLDPAIAAAALEPWETASGLRLDRD